MAGLRYARGGPILLQYVMYRCVMGIVPMSLSEKFESSRGSDDIITRSQINEELVVPKKKQTWRYSGNLLLIRDPESKIVWNRLPINVQRAGILKILRKCRVKPIFKT